MKRQIDSLNKKIFLFGTTRSKVQKKQTWKRRWYILMPDNKFKIFWNLVVLLLLCYTATIVPYRTAFVDENSEFMKYFEMLVDILFILDLPVNFLSAIELGENKFET